MIRSGINLVLSAVCFNLVNFAQSTAPPYEGTFLRPSSGTLSAPEKGTGLAHDDTSRTPESELNKTRLAITGGTLLASMIAIHVYQQNGWWRDNRAPFHFQEDLTYGLSVDKIGHFYGGYILGYTISKSLEWADMSKERALWVGAGGSLLFQSYIEIEDGFSAWGFDRIDWLSNYFGAALLPLRYYIPVLNNFDLKLSYHSSDLLGSGGGAGFKGQRHLMMDDYEGQTFWLSVKVNNLVPHDLEVYWPDFLCLSIGYGARDIAGSDPRRIWIIAPDLDMTQIIPGKRGFLKTLGEVLNFIHLPLPAVQFYPNTIWYGLYF